MLWPPACEERICKLGYLSFAMVAYSYLLFAWGEIGYGIFSLGSCWKCFRARNEMFPLVQVWVRVYGFFLSVAHAKSSVSSCVEEVVMQTGRCIVKKVVERWHFPSRLSTGEELPLPQGPLEWEFALPMDGTKVFLAFPKHLYEERPLR